MQKILFIVGPTGTGKTKIALQLSENFPSSLISADSRQVYRGMDIVTGKDHPEGFEIAGVDIVDPDEECSVAVWHDAVIPQIFGCLLPIVVGGTGLYVRALMGGIDTMHIPPDQKLRAELDNLPLTELKNRLLVLDKSKYESLNNSDINNPRRLIRAIELGAHPTYKLRGDSKVDSLIIGLQYSDYDFYQSQITRRVRARFAHGAVAETRSLLSKYSQTIPSLTAIGYRSIADFLNGNLTEAELIEKWTADELAYAKRQMTWFRKVPKIHWFDPGDSDTHSKIAKLVSDWYDTK